METTGYYRRPWWPRRRLYDPLVRALIRRTGWSGFGSSEAVGVLGVRGRRTGRWHHTPVGVCSRDGERYLIGFYGDSHWARNLRAGMDAELRVGRRVEPIRAAELAGDDKAAFLRFLVARYPLIVRVWWKVRASRLNATELERLVSRYPVFRVQRA